MRLLSTFEPPSPPLSLPPLVSLEQTSSQVTSACLSLQADETCACHSSFAVTEMFSCGCVLFVIAVYQLIGRISERPAQLDEEVQTWNSSIQAEAGGIEG